MLGPGQHTFTWVAQDGAGNQSSCDQSVVVVDDVAPELAVPQSATAEAARGACEASVALAATLVRDACEGDASSLVSDAPASFPVGTTEVHWTATDSSGNAAHGTTAVTVTDAVAPVVDCDTTGAAAALAAGESVVAGAVDGGGSPFGLPDDMGGRATAGVYGFTMELQDQPRIQTDDPGELRTAVRGGGCDAGGSEAVPWWAVLGLLLFFRRRS